jgi:hypothetical protein
MLGLEGSGRLRFLRSRATLLIVLLFPVESVPLVKSLQEADIPGTRKAVGWAAATSPESSAIFYSPQTKVI